MNLSTFEHLKNRRVFLTGHTGFKGSWLTMWLKHLGCEVAGYAMEPPTDPSNFETCNIGSLVERHIVDDLRNEKRIHAEIADFEPDLIMHLAAQSVVKHGYEDPIETFSTNVMGTANVLEAVRKIGRPCAVFCVTSDKCYENVEQPWGYRECDAMGDLDPYGGSKGAAELVIRSYRSSYFSPSIASDHGVWLASGRAGNVIGGGDWTDGALLVDVVKSILTGETAAIRNPNAQRPWQHVLQCLSGYLTVSARLLKKDDPAVCSGWNFGPLPGSELPVRDVVELFIETWGAGAWVDISTPEQAREAQILRLSIDKAIWGLGWKPAWTVHESLKRTVEWFQQWNSNAVNMQEFSIAQIESYQEDFLKDGAAMPRGIDATPTN